MGIVIKYFKPVRGTTMAQQHSRTFKAKKATRGTPGQAAGREMTTVTPEGAASRNLYRRPPLPLEYAGRIPCPSPPRDPASFYLFGWI
jgi:hypothetical protein